MAAYAEQPNTSIIKFVQRAHTAEGITSDPQGQRSRSDRLHIVNRRRTTELRRLRRERRFEAGFTTLAFK